MDQDLIITSLSPQRTHEIGRAIGRCARAGDIVRLWGDLGAGKTCLVRGIADGMGIDMGLVHSPTYTIANEYRGAGTPLIHIDAYRFTGDDDLDAIGWDAMTDGSAVLCVEWPERLGDAITGVVLDVSLRHVDDETREIGLRWPSSWHAGPSLIGLLTAEGAPE